MGCEGGPGTPKVSGQCLVTAILERGYVERARRGLGGNLCAVQAFTRICGSPGGPPAWWYSGPGPPRSLPEQLVWLRPCCHHPAKGGPPGGRGPSCPRPATSQGEAGLSFGCAAGWPPCSHCRRSPWGLTGSGPPWAIVGDPRWKGSACPAVELSRVTLAWDHLDHLL